jgi:hypothetical protein
MPESCSKWRQKDEENVFEMHVAMHYKIKNSLSDVQK